MAEDLAGNPMDALARWVAEAGAAGSPSTMTLATADAEGTPHARTVLVTTIDTTSLRFHSSTPTTKTRDLAVNPRVSGVFHWPTLGRQVVLHGTATELDAATSRAAFGTRPRALQRVGWVYETLRPVAPDFAVAPGAVQEAFDAARDAVDMPASWTTIAFTPVRLDLWQAGDEERPPSRTRFVADGGGWRSFPVLP